MHSLRFKYQTIEFGTTDIHLRTLKDRQQYADAEAVAARLGISSANWSLFGVVWASGEILARVMYDYDIADQRILEVGCGIGLASLVLNHRRADITATDYHPEAGNFLSENTQLNQGRAIPFVRTGWTDEKTDLGRFDTIIGSDLLYEQVHAEQLAGFIAQHANPCSQVIIVDPGRKYCTTFSRHMENKGYHCHHVKASDYFANLTQPERGVNRYQILRFIRDRAPSIAC